MPTGVFSHPFLEPAFHLTLQMLNIRCLNGLFQHILNINRDYLAIIEKNFVPLPSIMKKKLLTLTLTLCVCSIPLWAIVSGRSLTNTLKELCTELQTAYQQRAEVQKRFNDDFERQHQRMIDVITESNELSIRIGYEDRAKEVIYETLTAAGITIAFPQCDVHLISSSSN